MSIEYYMMAHRHLSEQISTYVNCVYMSSSCLQSIERSRARIRTPVHYSNRPSDSESLWSRKHTTPSASPSAASWPEGQLLLLQCNQIQSHRREINTRTTGRPKINKHKAFCNERQMPCRNRIQEPVNDQQAYE